MIARIGLKDLDLAPFADSHSKEERRKYSQYATVDNIGCLECESPWMSDDGMFRIVEGMTYFYFNWNGDRSGLRIL